MKETKFIYVEFLINNDENMHKIIADEINSKKNKEYCCSSA